MNKANNYIQMGDKLLQGSRSKSDSQEAVRLFTCAADSGDPDALIRLGYCLLHGIGGETDKEKALKYYKIAAEKGNHVAENNIGCYYNQDKDGIYDAVQAGTWFEKACKGGLPQAYFNLANSYRRGLGRMIDISQKIDQAKQAIEQGDIEAHYILACIYLWHHGHTRDEEALSHFKIAAEYGHSPSLNNIGYCYYFGYGIPENPQIAFNYFLRSAVAGNSLAVNNLGVWFEENGHDDDHLNMAFNLIYQSASQNNDLTIVNLALCYQNGIGVDKDIQKYNDCWKRVPSGILNKNITITQLLIHPDEKYLLGVRKFEDDQKKAFNLYLTAANMGYTKAMVEIALLFRHGCGTVKDQQESKKWFHKAAKLGDSEAQTEMGKFMIVSGDLQDAYHWFDLAAAQGNYRYRDIIFKDKHHSWHDFSFHIKSDYIETTDTCIGYE